VLIRWTGLAPWEFGFPFPGSLTSTFPHPTPHTPQQEENVQEMKDEYRKQYNALQELQVASLLILLFFFITLKTRVE